MMKNASISDNTDATLALKGILGIGALNKTDPSPKNSVPGQSTLAGGAEASTENAQQQPKSSTKKKKKQSKENKSNRNVEKKLNTTRERNTSKKQRQPKSEQQPQHQGSNQKGMKKKSPKVGSSGGTQTKQKQSQKKQQQKKNENFAWSAFQSPPDPSKLPLPAFGNSFSFDDNNNSNVDKLFDQEVNNDTTDDPVVENLSTPTKQAVESQMTSVQKTENEIKAILNIRNDNETPTKEEEKAVEQSQNNDVSYASKVKKHNDRMQSEQHQQESSMSSPHGINLATLTISADPAIIDATSPPPKQKNGKNVFTNNSASNTPQPLNPNSNSSHGSNTTDPIAMLMNAQSYGTANPTIHSPHQSYNMYNHNQLHSPHHYPVHHAYTISPQHHQMMPPYYTIQVQVPPVLMPGRRMIVPASPMTGGYPIPVVVPEGAAPGMFIPVSIPNPNTTRGTNAIVHHH